MPALGVEMHDLHAGQGESRCAHDVRLHRGVGDVLFLRRERRLYLRDGPAAPPRRAVQNVDRDEHVALSMDRSPSLRALAPAASAARVASTRSRSSQ